MKFRTKYSNKIKVSLDQKKQKSLTKQSDKDKCDVNLILKKFEKTGQLPSNGSQPIYGDFSNMPDYNKALNSIINAQDKFYNLPAEIRALFSNDPAQLIKFVDDPKNKDEAISLGLLPQQNLNSLNSTQTEGAGEAASEVKGEAALSENKDL
ncbi:internal scaffolding protein [Microviridae sp.]|nr:internal scaffolding protein [Microviridae sp.]